MTVKLGHLGQFDEIDGDSRIHNFLSNYILMLGYFRDVYCVRSFQVHRYNFTYTYISRF